MAKSKSDKKTAAAVAMDAKTLAGMLAAFAIRAMAEEEAARANVESLAGYIRRTPATVHTTPNEVVFEIAIAQFQRECEQRAQRRKAANV